MTGKWPNGARLALSLVINVEEGAEQNISDGDKGPDPVDELQAIPHKPIRAHANETNYQYGLIEGLPRIIKLLDEFKAPATWTAAGLALERAPDAAKAIISRGDEICCHGYRWAPQFLMDETEERDFITKGRDVIASVANVRPLGWLSRYLHTDNTKRILVEEGFLYHMDDFSRDEPFWDYVKLSDGESLKPLIILPYALDTNDMKFWLTPAFSPQDWLAYLKDTFDCLYAEGADRMRIMSVGLHLRIVGRPGRIWALRAFLEYVAGKPDVWMSTRLDLAKTFATMMPPKL
jgi:peptidoglycan/xylan/chitin deacetylase (PgdA/CDA1 family)